MRENNYAEWFWTDAKYWVVEWVVVWAGVKITYVCSWLLNYRLSNVCVAHAVQWVFLGSGFFRREGRLISQW